MVSQNGVIDFAYRVPLQIATSGVAQYNPCNIQSPTSTSTIVYASTDLRTSTGTANLIELAKSATSGATTTVLARTTVAANAFTTLVASSTLQTSDNWIIAPSNFIVVKFGANYGSTTPRGSCQVIFRITS